MEFHHPLLIEFAEHRDLILRLKEESEEFRKRAEEYHELDRHICLIERDLEPRTDRDTEVLKKKRALLKDLLYHDIIKAAEQVA